MHVVPHGTEAQDGRLLCFLLLRLGPLSRQTGTKVDSRPPFCPAPPPRPPPAEVTPPSAEILRPFQPVARIISPKQAVAYDFFDTENRDLAFPNLTQVFDLNDVISGTRSDV